MAKSSQEPNFLTSPLLISGIESQLLEYRDRQNTHEILVIHGIEHTQQDMLPLSKVLASVSSVCVVALPGLDTSASLRKIGEAATLDGLADYLATFVQFRFKRRKFSIVGVGSGFSIATLMLQRHPDILKKVENVVSLGGWLNYENQPKDFKLGTSLDKVKNNILLRILRRNTTCDIRTYRTMSRNMRRLDLSKHSVETQCLHVNLQTSASVSHTNEQFLKVVYKKVASFNAAVEPTDITKDMSPHLAKRLISKSLLKRLQK